MFFSTLAARASDRKQLAPSQSVRIINERTSSCPPEGQALAPIASVAVSCAKKKRKPLRNHWGKTRITPEP
eukprot:4283336-Pyramimonas_sp.AAC.1